MDESTIVTSPAADAPAAPAAETDRNTLDGLTREVPGEGAPAALEAPAKPEKTPEERELARRERRIDNLTKRNYQLQARLEELSRAAPAPSPSQDDGETLTLSKAELQERIRQEAEKLAPKFKSDHEERESQEAERERRATVVKKLSADLGQAKFDALAEDLHIAFDGLAGRDGKPKPAVDALFESDHTGKLLEYLADPEHAAEAEALSKMSAVRAGREVARLESKLTAAARPQASKAPTPLEPAKAGGASRDAPNPSDANYLSWKLKQLKGR